MYNIITVTDTGSPNSTLRSQYNKFYSSWIQTVSFERDSFCHFKFHLHLPSE